MPPAIVPGFAAPRSADGGPPADPVERGAVVPTRGRSSRATIAAWRGAIRGDQIGAGYRCCPSPGAGIRCRQLSIPGKTRFNRVGLKRCESGGADRRTGGNDGRLRDGLPGQHQARRPRRNGRRTPCRYVNDRAVSSGRSLATKPPEFVHSFFAGTECGIDVLRPKVGFRRADRAWQTEIYRARFPRRSGALIRSRHPGSRGARWGTIPGTGLRRNASAGSWRRPARGMPGTWNEPSGS